MDKKINYFPKVMIYLSLLVSYFAYTIYGLILVANNYRTGICNYLWVYLLLSLLIPLAIVLIQFFLCHFILTDIKKISFIMFLMNIFGAISLSTCVETSSFWIFTLITFIIQIIITLFPFLINVYVFFCNLKTPCCCDDTTIVSSDNNFKVKEVELSNNKTLDVIV